jgi:hypothetical protein
MHNDSNLELFNDNEVTLAFEETCRDIACQGRRVLPRTTSGRWQRRKSPRESSQWDLFPGPDCHKHKMRATFPLQKKRPKKAQNVLYNVSLFSLEPGPHPNIICAIWFRSVSRAWPCRGPRGRPVLTSKSRTKDMELAISIRHLSTIQENEWIFLHT